MCTLYAIDQYTYTRGVHKLLRLQHTAILLKLTEMRGLCQVITDGKFWKPGTGHINKTKTYKMKKSFIAPYDISC